MAIVLLNNKYESLHPVVHSFHLELTQIIDKPNLVDFLFVLVLPVKQKKCM